MSEGSLASPLRTLSSGFSALFRRAAGVSSDRQERRPLSTAIDRLFETVDFPTEAATIEPGNVKITEQAFRRFLQSAGLTLSDIIS